MSFSIPRIQKVLVANAAFSGISGLLIMIFSEALVAQVMHLPVAVYRVLGTVLGLFALAVFLTARQAMPGRGSIMAILCADIAWLALTPVILLLLQQRLTGLGNLLLLVIAVAVALFAALEWLTLKRQTA